MGEPGMSCSESWPRAPTRSGLILHPGKSTPRVLEGCPGLCCGNDPRWASAPLPCRPGRACCLSWWQSYLQRLLLRPCRCRSPRANMSPLEGHFASPSAAVLLSLSLFIPNWIFCTQLSSSVEMLWWLRFQHFFFLVVIYCTLILFSVCSGLAGYVICRQARSGMLYK